MKAVFMTIEPSYQWWSQEMLKKLLCKPICLIKHLKTNLGLKFTLSVMVDHCQMLTVFNK